MAASDGNNVDEAMERLRESNQDIDHIVCSPKVKDLYREILLLAIASKRARENGESTDDPILLAHLPLDKDKAEVCSTMPSPCPAYNAIYLPCSKWLELFNAYLSELYDKEPLVVVRDMRARVDCDRVYVDDIDAEYTRSVLSKTQITHVVLWDTYPTGVCNTDMALILNPCWIDEDSTYSPDIFDIELLMNEFKLAHVSYLRFGLYSRMTSQGIRMAMNIMRDQLRVMNISCLVDDITVAHGIDYSSKVLEELELPSTDAIGYSSLLNCPRLRSLRVRIVNQMCVPSLWAYLSFGPRSLVRVCLPEIYNYDGSMPHSILPTLFSLPSLVILNVGISNHEIELCAKAQIKMVSPDMCVLRCSSVHTGLDIKDVNYRSPWYRPLLVTCKRNRRRRFLSSCSWAYACLLLRLHGAMEKKHDVHAHVDRDLCPLIMEMACMDDYAMVDQWRVRVRVCYGQPPSIPRWVPLGHERRLRAIHVFKQSKFFIAVRDAIRQASVNQPQSSMRMALTTQRKQRRSTGLCVDM